MKVADGNLVGKVAQSTHNVCEDELGSQFECRLVYNDGVGVEIQRSCRFSRPQVTITRLEDNRFYAFAHSSPPFVSDLNCTLEPSHVQVTYELFSEVPDFSNMTLGPVNSTQNDVNIVCRAGNMFGLGKANMTLKSVAPVNVRTFNVEVWPKSVILREGQNVTFACSYLLAMSSSSEADVSIKWKYNQDPIDKSKATFVIADNLLHVSGLDNGHNRGADHMRCMDRQNFRRVTRFSGDWFSESL